MKISKAKLRQIIREELSESEWDDPLTARSSVEAAHDLTKGAPIDALLRALRVVSSPMLDATIRKLAFDVVKDLEEADFNDFVAALED